MKCTGEVRVNPARQNHYEVLEVELFASDDAIRRSYRKLVRKWHPDTNPSPEATARTATLNIARQVLLDPRQRETYDRELRVRLGRNAPAAGAARPGRQSPPQHPSPQRTRPKPGSGATTGKRTSTGTKKPSAGPNARAQGAAAPEPQPQPPRDERLAWDDTRFVAGHAYRSRAGIFEVIEIRDRVVDIRYGDGPKLSLARHPLWEQWQRIARQESQPSGTTASADQPPPTHQTIRERVLAGGKEQPALEAVVAAGELLFAVGWATTTDMRGSGGGYWVLPAPPNEIACDRLLRDMKAQGIPLEQGMLAGGARPGEKRPAWFYRPPADTTDPPWR
jgi:hypothetical protein